MKAKIGLWVLLLAAPAIAGTPDWLRAAAQTPLPSYPPETDAVILYDEQVTTVKESGEVRTTYRRAYKILRPQGSDYGKVYVFFDSDTKIGRLIAWSIPAGGKDYEVKEKDAMELGYDGGELFNDNRYKVLTIPAAEPGSVVGYEYEQKKRSFVLQDVWDIQESIPVVVSRFTLQLPNGWEYRMRWRNHPEQAPVASGANQWTWEVRNVPAVEHEPAMPALRAVAARGSVQFFPRAGAALNTWNDIAAWYLRMTADRRQSTPAIQQKVAELTGGAASAVEKARRLATYVQREIRYVAIEIGIGGYVPHSAAAVFGTHYGDCKDKATLLGTMLRDAGIESYYVIVHTKRGVVDPEYASIRSFNHVILGIKLPEASAPGLEAWGEVPGLGKLLFFDPTDSVTPFGQLPSYAHANHVLVVAENGGHLVKLPLAPPEANQLQRVAKLSLSPNGTLSGEVVEKYRGPMATERRAAWREMGPAQQRKRFENFLSMFLANFQLQSFEVRNLGDPEKELEVTYRFQANNYAKTAGDLLLFRPRVLGEKSEFVFEDRKKKERRHPVEFDTTTLQTDRLEIALPSGFTVDELPPPMDLDAGIARYKSRAEVKGGVLHYEREYQVRDVFAAGESLKALKQFYRQVAGEEHSAAVLKRGP